MDALLHRDDVPIKIVLNKALKDSIATVKENEYIKKTLG